MKKVIAILLAITMLSALFVSGTTVSAEENYTVLYKNEEVTDVQQLLQMYNWSQQAAQRPLTGDAALMTVDDSGEEERLIIPQTLECREYADGRIVYDMSATELSAYDENGVATTASVAYDSYSSSYSYNLVHVTHTTRYSYYADGDIYANVSYIRATLNNKGSADTVNLRLVIRLQEHFSTRSWSDSLDVSSAVVGKTYTLTNTTGSYDIPLERLYSKMITGTYVGVNTTIPSAPADSFPQVVHNTALFITLVNARV